MHNERLPTGEAICSQQDLTTAMLEQLQQCDHEWVVFATEVTNVLLMLECVRCGAFATVNDPTQAEWGQAFHAPRHPYRWSDKMRVIIRCDHQK